MPLRKYDSRLRSGDIVLFTRNGAPTYHARIKIPGRSGHVTKSLRTADYAEAVAAATEIRDELRQRVRQGLSVGRYTFADIWKMFIENEGKKSLSVHRLRYLEGTARRYFLPFLGGTSIADVTDLKIEKFWDWRLAYWQSAAGKQKIEKAKRGRGGKHGRVDKPTARRSTLGNVAKRPSNKTLQMEQTALRQVLGWAHRRALVNRVPYVKAPRDKTKKGVDRRPAFTVHELVVLGKKLTRWMDEAGEKPPKRPDGRFGKPRVALHRPHALHRWQRTMLFSYVLFMAASGLRPNEARQLRWRDVRYERNSQGEYTVLTTSHSTKTGSREVVCLQAAKASLERVRKNSDHTKPGDLVFAHRDGTPIQFLGKTFKKLLGETWVVYGASERDVREVGEGEPGAHRLLFDPTTGDERTIYSLRHTYATIALQKGKGMTYDKLARNMGTSPGMIFKHYHHATVREDADVLSMRQ